LTRSIGWSSYKSCTTNTHTLRKEAHAYPLTPTHPPTNTHTHTFFSSELYILTVQIGRNTAKLNLAKSVHVWKTGTHETVQKEKGEQCQAKTNRKDGYQVSLLKM